jgi:uncharacterized protein
VDASEPDPEAAAGFYGGLFGWEFEEVMPPGSDGRYSIAPAARTGRGRGRVDPEAAPPMAMWNTYIWVESADETASKVRDAGGGIAMSKFVPENKDLGG